jgi:hypothetical protein
MQAQNSPPEHAYPLSMSNCPIKPKYCRGDNEGGTVDVRNGPVPQVESVTELLYFFQAATCS